MPIFLSIGQIVRELELPPLNMNAKQFSLYGTTLSTSKAILIRNLHILFIISIKFEYSTSSHPSQKVIYSAKKPQLEIKSNERTVGHDA